MLEDLEETINNIIDFNRLMSSIREFVYNYKIYIYGGIAIILIGVIIFFIYIICKHRYFQEFKEGVSRLRISEYIIFKNRLVKKTINKINYLYLLHSDFLRSIMRRTYVKVIGIIILVSIVVFTFL